MPLTIVKTPGPPRAYWRQPTAKEKLALLSAVAKDALASDSKFKAARGFLESIIDCLESGTNLSEVSYYAGGTTLSVNVRRVLGEIFSER